MHHSRDLSSGIFSVLKYLMLVFAAFMALIPVIVCVVTAFKTPAEYQATNVMTPPANWLNFANFIEAFARANMGTAFLNTGTILIIVLAGSILFGTMMAYVLSRFRFPGNTLIRNLFLFASLIPGIAMQVTVYGIMYQLRLIDKLYGYMILLMGTDIISIYIFIQFFENIPVSLDESAIMDGASYYSIFFKILFPLLKPAIVTVMILKGVGTYNEYYMANLYLQSKDRLVTVATSLFKFTGPLGNQYNLICAGLIITLIPAVLIFIICQKHIYAGMTLGAVKS